MPVFSGQDVDKAARYAAMFESMKIPGPYQPVLIALAKRAMKYKADYDKVSSTINIPWYIVAVIHYREANFSMVEHLHNGDPLTARTVHVPKGRPVNGNPPFEWYESAIDALLYDDMENTDEYTLGELLVMLERYNGVGYTKYHKMESPYLWSYTQYYTKGYYRTDGGGGFDPNYVNKQAGCAPLIAALIDVNAGWD